MAPRQKGVQKQKAEKSGLFKHVVIALVIGVLLEVVIVYFTLGYVYPSSFVSQIRDVDWRIVVLDLLFIKPFFFLCGCREGSSHFDRQLLNLLLLTSPPFNENGIRSVDFTVPTVFPPNSADHYEIPVRLFIPEASINDQNRIPLLIYFHGGGFILGSPKDQSFDMLARNLAKDSNMFVLSVDYRLAPENPFPVPVEDCYAVLDWLGKHHSAYWPTKKPGKPFVGDVDLLFAHTDFNRVLVGGDSAGGNLAAVVSLMATKSHRNLPFKLRHQLLIYPGFFFEPPTKSSIELRGAPCIPAPISSYSRKFYLRESLFLRPNQTLFNHVYVNPLRESDSVLATVPSATLILAKFDPLKDEGHMFARKLKELNVDVQTYEFNSTHAFFAFPFLEETKQARKLISDNLRRVFQSS